MSYDYTTTPEETTNVPAVKASIHEIVGHRGRALDLYGEAFDLLKRATSEQQRAATGEAPVLAFGRYSNMDVQGDRDAFLKKCRVEVDRGIWRHLMSTTKMDTIMDRKARDEFRAQLDQEPPEATVENCLATIEQLLGDSDMIFKRGVAEAFSGLDRRFRSHDGFKVGSRIVLTYCFSEFGRMNQRQVDTIRDVERAFYIFDGRSPPDWNEGICAKVNAHLSGLTRRAFQSEDDYFTLKAYKNGNGHLWFKRDDLLERVNLLLADYYGAVVGQGPDTADKYEHVRSTAVAKNMGFFRTPDQAAKTLFERGCIQVGGKEHPRLKVLEPSAGDGALAFPLMNAGHDVTCVEAHPGRAAELSQWTGLKVISHDFLDITPTPKFDRVIMNPPFDRTIDIDHVRHAFKFLKPGGILCAIMSAGTEYREDAKTVAFRDWVGRFRVSTYRDSPFEDLPAGSFKESGTMVNALTVTLRMPD